MESDIDVDLRQHNNNDDNDDNDGEHENDPDVGGEEGTPHDKMVHDGASGRAARDYGRKTM